MDNIDRLLEEIRILKNRVLILEQRLSFTPQNPWGIGMPTEWQPNINPPYTTCNTWGDNAT